MSSSTNSSQTHYTPQVAESHLTIPAQSLEKSFSADPTIKIDDIIGILAYKEMVLVNTILDLKPAIAGHKLVTKRYPDFIYKFKKAGLHDADTVFENAILGLIFMQVQTRNRILTGVDFITIWNKVLPPHLNKFILKDTDRTKSVEKYLNEILQFTINTFSQYPELIFDFEVSFGIIEDRIHVLSSEYIMLLVTSSNFNKNSEHSIIKLFIEKAIIDNVRQNAAQPLIKYAGIFLTLQQKILWFNLENWNKNNLLNLIQDQSLECCVDKHVAQIVQSNYPQGLSKKETFSDAVLETHVCERLNIDTKNVFMDPRIGSHIKKEDDFPSHVPFQFFIANPQGAFNLSDGEIAQLSARIKLGMKAFIHAPYIVNLSSEQNWGADRLQAELRAGHAIGASGVVFHVGKHVEESYMDGFLKMIRSMRFVIESASIQCPLILETPAGQGTEVAASLDSFLYVMSQFPQDLGKRFKVCIDSCHVFSLGYDPTYFLDKIHERYPGSVALIHFNDSQNCRGARIDRHIISGKGYIGYDRMRRFFGRALELGIPCVTE